MMLTLPLSSLLPPVAPVNVAVARILFCAFLLSRIDNYLNFVSYLRFPVELFTPNGALVSLEVAHWVAAHRTELGVLWKTATVFGLVGLFTTPALVVSSAIGFLFLSFPQAFQANLYLYLPLISLGAFLALSAAGDALSVDQWWRERRGAPPVLPAARHALFFRLGQFLFVFFIFSSGYFKLTKTGAEWIFSDNLRNTFLCSPFTRIDFVPGVFSGLGLNAWVAQFSTLSRALAFCTVLAQLLTPLALVHRQAARAALLFFVSFQLAALLLLFIDSSVNLVLYLPWFDAGGFWARWQAWRCKE